MFLEASCGGYLGSFQAYPVPVEPDQESCQKVWLKVELVLDKDDVVLLSSLGRDTLEWAAAKREATGTSQRSWFLTRPPPGRGVFASGGGLLVHK